MLKLVLYSFLLMTNTFALTSEEFFKPIDLEKIEKFTPDNKEVLKYGGDHKGFVDEDGDLADDRLEVFFNENDTSKLFRYKYHRKLYLYRVTANECKKDKNSFDCRILLSSNYIIHNKCKGKEQVDPRLSTLFSSIFLTDYYKHGVLVKPELAKWAEKNKSKTYNLLFDCEVLK